MSEFLTINGYEVEVSSGGVSGSYDEGADRARAFSGRYLSTVRYEKEEYSLSSPLLTKADAIALRGLLRGLGHCWSFDNDLYSSKGLGPQAGSTATQSASGGKFGGRAIIANVVFAANVTQDWTVLLYRYWHAWKHWAMRSDGAIYLNGVRDDTLDTHWLSVDGSGNVTITGELWWIDSDTVAADRTLVASDTVVASSTGAEWLTRLLNRAPEDTIQYDDLVIVPYAMTDEMILSFEDSGAPFSPLPRLNASGDMLERDIVCECLVERWPYQKVGDGVRQTVSFGLMEV